MFLSVILNYGFWLSLSFLPCLSLAFTFMQSPLSMALTILIKALIISLILCMMTSTSWFSYLLLMVFLSGMMIIFIYVSSLASNEIYFSNTSYFLMVIFSMTMFMYFLKTPPVSKTFLVNLKFSVNSFFCYKIYSPFLLTLTTIMIIYLLIALLVVVKNSLLSEGPLRSK